jgi:hypothetical protein
MRSLLLALALCTATTIGSARADTVIEWAPGKDGPQKSYTVDRIKLTLAAGENADGESPRLDVASNDGAAITVFGAERSFPDMPVKLRVTRLDPSHSDADIMFGVFTGGAHCCMAIKVLSLIKGTWKLIDLGMWDGDEMPEPKDTNGMITLAFYDNAFLYAFASYAESFAPLKILRIVAGSEIDVSAAPELMQLHRENMTEARQSCLEHHNGACAAYVASAARLGMFPEAWNVMLANYDPHSDWQLEFCEVPGKDQCARSVTFDSFPRALDWFLHKNGYLSADQSRPIPQL